MEPLLPAGRYRGSRITLGRLIALPDFDQVAVRVTEVAAGFLPAVDWGCLWVRRQTLMMIQLFASATIVGWPARTISPPRTSL